MLIELLIQLIIINLYVFPFDKQWRTTSAIDFTESDARGEK